MTPSEWKAINDAVVTQMNRHTQGFLSPVSTSVGYAGRHVGTGTFVLQRGRRLLLSCEHVLSVGQDYRFYGTDKVWGRRGSVHAAKGLDLAFLDIDDEAWFRIPHEAKVVSYLRFAKRYETICPEELLFLRGYAGENSRFLIDTLTSNVSGYLSQEVKGTGTAGFFEIFWDPQQTQYSVGTPSGARSHVAYRDPQGFSGSLVWNTRYLEVTQAGGRWTPGDAVVVGMVQSWDPTTRSLLVRRVEHLRRWLDETTPRWTLVRALSAVIGFARTTWTRASRLVRV